MKFFCKLTRNGNATTVCIPRRVMKLTQWRTGDPMVVEMLTFDSVTIRPPRADDMRSSGVLRFLDNSLPEATK